MTRLTLAALLLSTSPLCAQVPRVVADVPINHSLAALVMGDLGTPELLLDRGGDAHHAHLRPSQARAVAGADLVIWTGPALSPWMAEVVHSLAAARVLELADVDGLDRQPYGATVEFGEDAHDDHDHDHDGHDGHDHGHEDHDDHGHGHDDHGHDDHDHGHDDHGHDDHGHDHDDHGHGHDHAHGDFDPHLWMNTANAARWVEAIAETLSALDAANADTYRRNADDAVSAIGALRGDLAQTLAPARGAGLVFHHDAFGYLAREFGLNVLGTIADGNAADPGAARIAALRAELAQAGAACIFPEVNHSDAFARIVAEGTALRIGAPLDPEGVTHTPGPGLYAETMRSLAQAIADCAQGG